MSENADSASPLDITVRGEFPAWIDFKTQAPAEGQRILFCDDGNDDVGIGFYMEEDHSFWIEAGSVWMPSPEAPNAK